MLSVEVRRDVVGNAYKPCATAIFLRSRRVKLLCGDVGENSVCGRGYLDTCGDTGDHRRAVRAAAQRIYRHSPAARNGVADQNL